MEVKVDRRTKAYRDSSLQGGSGIPFDDSSSITEASEGLIDYDICNQAGCGNVLPPLEGGGPRGAHQAEPCQVCVWKNR